MPDSDVVFIPNFSALPAHFKKGMENQEASEGGAVVFRCELTKAASVKWKKKHKSLEPSDKYEMRQEGAAFELAILNVELKDAGDYSCVCGDQKTTATLTVHGKSERPSYSVSGCFGQPHFPVLFCLICQCQNVLCDVFLFRDHPCNFLQIPGYAIFPLVH